MQINLFLRTLLFSWMTFFIGEGLAAEASLSFYEYPSHPMVEGKLLDPQGALDAPFSYDNDYFRKNVGEYHDKGHQWSEKQLEDFFFASIFIHYADKLMLPFEAMRSPRTAPAFEWKALVWNALQENPQFRHLGASYSRGKILLEKKEKELRNASEQDQPHLQRELISLNKEITDRQVLIYYWMKDVGSAGYAIWRKHNKEHPPLGPDNRFLADVREGRFYPPYLESASYRGLLRR